MQCSILETGEHIISGAGELHLEICVSDLNEFVGGVELKVSQPAVSFRETVTATSSRTVMSKSPNKHNRLYAQASPMGDSLIEAIGAGQVGEAWQGMGRQMEWGILVGGSRNLGGMDVGGSQQGVQEGRPKLGNHTI